MDKVASNSAASQTESGAVRLRVEGMTCGSCVARVERALSSVPGVRNARVNLATETAVVDFEQNSLPPAPLISAVRSAGYDAEVFRPADNRQTDIEKTSASRLRQQKQATWQAIAVAIPIMTIHWLAPLIQSHEHGGHVWATAVQALLSLFLLGSSAGAPILAAGMQALLHRAANMDLLISIGVSAAFLAGAFSLITAAPDQGEFDAVAMILAFINVGRLMELRARHGAGEAVAALTRKMPAVAHLVTPDGIVVTPIEKLRPGDLVRISADSVIPVDGEVIDGNAAVDESTITGESLPRALGPGDAVFGGSMIVEGIITVRATKLGAESMMGRIIRAVDDAQSGKTPLQRIADRVAGVFVPIVIGLAIATFLGMYMVAGLETSAALRRAVAVLIIACPCAMGLAAPTALLVGVGAAAAKGILVRDPVAFEAASRIQLVFFDKTGTLTAGSPVVESIVPLPGIRGLPEDDSSRTFPSDFSPESLRLLRLAASAEQFSQHPIARAIVQSFAEKNFRMLETYQFGNVPGQGVRALVGGVELFIGGEQFMNTSGVNIDLAHHPSGITDPRARTTVFVAAKKELIGFITLSDAPRSSAPQAVEELRAIGIETRMITGDREAAALSVAKFAGIDFVYAERLPEEKLALVKAAQAERRFVAFVGDGVNDAPALAAADVGISFGNPADVAIGAAPITILHTDLTRIPFAIMLARKTVRVIKQNFFWAFFYNLAAIPLAAAGKISPGIAAACMMFSSISVVLNSLRIKRLPSQKGT